ncbi:glycosyltransferase family 4 protein [Desulfovibrio sulfodismutans]|uniref:Glycosyltransferase family 4 protein n=1 Tax=Desulfolutivibrio sulfodismutans TaxID=63561 RepID=A0A7K3NJI9_9BACT|nr:glycosyltransferase family 4 protein [Desulfolutivibrio sulfodismutans]NDY56362.1 glycosyltransferase family 4 protein [Desulfolutivibrio sulfodismutans]
MTRATDAGRLIAVTGTRGIPATWGGVERQCEELYSRLAARGFDILVYARRGYVEAGVASHRGVAVKTLPAPRSTHFEALVHTFLSVLHMAFVSRPRIVHVYSQGPCLLLPLVRLVLPRATVFFTCGGLDWRRRKWNGPAALALRLGEWFSARLTDVRIMVSKDLAISYRERFHCDCEVIHNGVALPGKADTGRLADMGLDPGGYALSVGRLTPEKRVEDMVAAVLGMADPMPLAVVGDEASGAGYAKRLRQQAGGCPAVVFTGYRFDAELAALFAGAMVFVTASDLEGFPLTLLEAMSYGIPCLASDIAPHREALGDDHPWFFPVGDVSVLGTLLEAAAASPDLRSDIGERGRRRVKEAFSWERAADALAALYNRALDRTSPERGKTERP